MFETKPDESILTGRSSARTAQEVAAAIDARKQSGFRNHLARNIGRSLSRKVDQEYAKVDALAKRTAAEDRLLKAYGNARSTYLDLDGQLHQLEKSGDDNERRALHERTIDRLNGLFSDQRQELLDALQGLEQGGVS
ncbi:hypothetical protein DSCW_01910 [Desulfosarcina widdelii]|uniref:Uncharacterized protein n=1 Tax=Desulfosarcina widdelii TaxID=947919 RepID=A0A5K7Z2T2_9BACT|nr:hypothetical protein [Desulfosarcina widdelii]BBO72774.1 hypothetical protein DSCW_01910 [Desulfosarcina widdelii]